MTVKNVGYNVGVWSNSYAPYIQMAGDVAISVNDPSTQLTGINILSMDIGGYNYIGSANISAIESAVRAGMVLMVNDWSSASNLIPGGSGITFIGSGGTNIEVVNDQGPITNGPGGVVNDVSLDNGSWSYHGYGLASSLPAGAEVILTNGDSNNAVAFGYQYGLGYVYYAGMPLDAYLGNDWGPSVGMKAYATNLINYLETKVGMNVNMAPVAVADTFTTNEDTALTTGNVLANDTDADGNTLTAALVSGVAHGTLVLNTNGTFSYTPAANYNGADSFTYKANDGQADSNVATVNITVNPVNDTPTANNDSVSVNEDASVTLTFAQLLGNDVDADGTTPTITAINTTGLKGHAVIDTDAKTVTYTADADEFDFLATNTSIVDTFSYTMKSSNGVMTANANVAVTVTGIADTNTLKGTSKADSLTGGNGEDSISGGLGADLLSGGLGTDTLDGGNGKDTLNGDDGADSLSGGNDNDVLNGGNGNDTLNGGNGLDTLEGGAGNDKLTGSTGADTFVFKASSGIDTITDFNAVQGDVIQISGIGITDFASLTLSHTGSNTHIDLGGGNEIVLTGVALSNLGAGQFSFA